MVSKEESTQVTGWVEDNMRQKEESWFVCQTNPREERRAKHYLAEKGFEVYLPMMEAQRYCGPRPVLMQKPLFSSYLFVRFNQETDLTHIRWTRGVRKILPESVSPVGVDDQLIDSIRAFAHKDGVIRKQPLRQKDRVRILSGPFREFVGIFEQWTSDRGRVRILLQFVQCHARLELHHTLVEKVA